jgi:hypothetical protein
MGVKYLVLKTQYEIGSVRGIQICLCKWKVKPYILQAWLDVRGVQEYKWAWGVNKHWRVWTSTEGYEQAWSVVWTNAGGGTNKCK